MPRNVLDAGYSKINMIHALQQHIDKGIGWVIGLEQDAK